MSDIRKRFKLVQDILTRSGYSDNGRKHVSSDTVDIPIKVLKEEAVIVRYPDGVRGLKGQFLSRIDVNGKSYLVDGDVKS